MPVAVERGAFMPTLVHIAGKSTPSRKFHSYSEVDASLLGRDIGEEWVSIAGFPYRNIRVTEFEGHVYLVSHKAVLTLNLTPVCNASCDFCYNGITFFPGHDTQGTPGELSRMLDFAEAGGVKHVSLSGGEPTIVPDRLFQTLEEMRGRFSGFVRVHTNGSQLHRRVRYGGREMPIFEHMAERGVTSLSLSRAHMDPAGNEAIMRLARGSSLDRERLAEVVAAIPSLRLSCFVHPAGVATPEAMLAYVEQGVEWGVKDFVFRISSGIPQHFALPGRFSDGNAALLKPTAAFKAALEAEGFELTFARQEIDYDLYILERDGVVVSVDRSSDVCDADRKIRRLILMPNGVSYTSWLESASSLFPDGAERAVRASGTPGRLQGPFPARRARAALYGGAPGSQIDLHVHSRVSDGVLSPSEVITRLQAGGVRVGVFAEHNAVHDSFRELQRHAEEVGFTIPFPGAEVSVNCSADGADGYRFHLLVYGDGLLDEDFRAMLARGNEAQNEHLTRIYHELVAGGMELPPLHEIFTVPEEDPRLRTRKHMYHRRPFAEVLARVLGVTPEEASQRHLPPLPPGAKLRNALDAEAVIRRADMLGCVTVLAHPGWIRPLVPGAGDDMESLLRAVFALRGAGLDGIEVDHRLNSPDQRARLGAFARSMDMVVTGGSDFHGRPADVVGAHSTTPENLERIHYILDAKVQRSARVHAAR